MREILSGNKKRILPLNGIAFPTPIRCLSFSPGEISSGDHPGQSPFRTASKYFKAFFCRLLSKFSSAGHCGLSIKSVIFSCKKLQQISREIILSGRFNAPAIQPAIFLFKERP